MLDTSAPSGRTCFLINRRRESGSLIKHNTQRPQFLALCKFYKADDLGLTAGRDYLLRDWIKLVPDVAASEAAFEYFLPADCRLLAK